jgi:hypothetical protein
MSDALPKPEQIKNLSTTPPPGVKDRVVGAVEAVVDGTPQKLKLVRPYYESHKSIPGDLSSEAQIVLHNLFSCFDRTGSVKEGQVKDIVWGFNVSLIPPACTYKGLGDLYRAGYVDFTDADNARLSPDTADLPECFLRYKNRLLEMVYYPVHP